MTLWKFNWPIRAGRPKMAGPAAFYSRPTIGERLTRWLGFGQARVQPPDDWTDDTESAVFAPGYLISETRILFDWKDRIRILISGKAMVSMATRTDVLVSRSESISSCSVLPPWYKFKRRTP